jgi:hypothetical protein
MRILLKLVVKKYLIIVLTGFKWLKTEFGISFCECGNQHSGSMKGGYFLDHLRNYQFFKREILHDADIKK